MHRKLASQFDQIAVIPEKADVWGGSKIGRSVASSQSRVARLNKYALGELAEDMKEDLFPISSPNNFNST